MRATIRKTLSAGLAGVMLAMCLTTGFAAAEDPVKVIFPAAVQFERKRRLFRQALRHGEVQGDLLVAAFKHVRPQVRRQANAAHALLRLLFQQLQALLLIVGPVVHIGHQVAVEVCQLQAGTHDRLVIFRSKGTELRMVMPR